MNHVVVKDLHRRLHRAIDEQETDESLAIIEQLHQESCLTGKESFLNRYSHTHSFFSPLIHSVAKQNALVALHFLEKGCNPNIDPDYDSQDRFSVPFCFKSFFNVIGNPDFEVIFMTILEATNGLILDENSNSVLHIICQKKLTSWLEMVLNSPPQHHLLCHANNQGYLPMHVAANSNFLDFFNLVFNDLYDALSKTGCFIAKGQQVSASVGKRDSFEKAGKRNEGDIAARMHCGKEKTYDKEPNVKVRHCCESDREGKDNITVKANVAKLIRHRSKVNTMNHRSLTSLCGRDVDINTPVLERGVTVLHIAAHEMFPELVKLLLDLGANVNGSQTQSYSPLCTCLNSSNVEHNDAVVDVCQYLISAGANIDEFCTLQCFSFRLGEDDEVTPLHLAAKMGNKDVIRLLLNNGANPKLRSKALWKLPVQLALEGGQTECALALLDKRLYPDRFFVHFSDMASNSLLHSAGNYSESIVTQLMNLGCPLDQPNINNVFPLDKAIFYGNIPFIHAILSNCPHVLNLWKHFKACPPLHLAASSSLDCLPLCQILLSYGADIYARAYGKNMAYRRALRSDSYKNAVYLCEQMSRPFTLIERKELLEYAETRMGEELALRLKCRLENVPSLLSCCYDVVRQVFVKNNVSFKSLDSLPIPGKIVRGLKYQDGIV